MKKYFLVKHTPIIKQNGVVSELKWLTDADMEEGDCFVQLEQTQKRSVTKALSCWK